jgi:hypothetical protein
LPTKRTPISKLNTENNLSLFAYSITIKLFTLIDTGAGISVLFDSDKVQGLTLSLDLTLPVYG